MRTEPHPCPGRLVDFDPSCVEHLNRLIELTDIEIVVSSDWKYWVTLDELQIFYANQGIVKPPISHTPKSDDFTFHLLAEIRSKEISCWLEQNKGIERWAWVDDLDMRPFLPNSFFVEDETGICGKTCGMVEFFNTATKDDKL